MKNKVWVFIKLIVIFISIGFSIYFIKVIDDLNMLPSELFNILIIGYIVTNILNILCLIPKKIVSIIGVVLSIGIIITSCFGINHASNIANFLNNSFNNNGVEISSYNVAVLKSSDYKTIEDIDGKLMGYLSLDDNKDKCISMIEGKISTELKSFDDSYTLYEDLLNENIDSIVISEGFLQVLEDEYEDINDRIKIIYTFETEKKLNTNEENIDELKPINILISGSDSRSGKILTKTRSDVNMIMTIDPKNHKILLTSIPRDYYVQLHGTTGNKDKLTHAGIYGINMTKETLEDVFDIEIDYTVKVGFQSVIQIVDLIGGVDVESDIEFYSSCGDGGAKKIHVRKGMNHFTGAQALSYARERYAYKNGDNHRVQNQQQVLEAIIEKISKDKSLLMKYDELLNSFGELYRTDIPSDYIKLTVKEQLTNMKSWKVEKQQVSGTGAMLETYSMPGRNLWVMIPDVNSVNQSREKILEYIK